MAHRRPGVLTVSAWTTTSSSAEVARLSLATSTESPSPRGGREFPARPAHGEDRTAMHWAAASRSKSDHRRGAAQVRVADLRLLLAHQAISGAGVLAQLGWLRQSWESAVGP